MNRALRLKKETNKTRIIFLSVTLNSIVLMFLAVLTVKMTLAFYGESINGVMRFISQIITYFLVVQNSFLLIFQIKIIKLYSNGEIEKIACTAKYLGVITRCVASGFLLFIISFAWVPAFFLSTGEINIYLVYFLFLALASNIFFSLFFLEKNTTLLIGTNNVHVVYITRTIVKIIVFIYFFAVVAWHPKLIYVLQNNKRIHTFAPGQLNKVFLIGVGYFLLATEGMISGIVIWCIVKRKKFNQVFVTKEMYRAYKKIVRKEIFSGMVKGIVLNCTFLIIFSTDEFVMLLFKDKMGGLAILKFISLYGLYTSMTNTIRVLIENYVQSKKVVVGYCTDDVQKRKSIMKEIKTNTQLMAASFLFFSVFIVPFLVSFLFAPQSDFSYVNFRLSIPIGIFGWIVLMNTPNKIEMEVDNKLKTLIWIFFTEAVLNIILSTTLAIYTGIIYWILWASVIAGTIKIGIFEFYFLTLKNAKNIDAKYNSQFLIFFNIRKNVITFLLITTVAALALTIGFTNFYSINFPIGKILLLLFSKWSSYLLPPTLFIFVVAVISFGFLDKKKFRVLFKSLKAKKS